MGSGSPQLRIGGMRDRLRADGSRSLVEASAPGGVGARWARASGPVPCKHKAARVCALCPLHNAMRRATQAAHK